MIYAITNRKLTAGGEENFLDQVRKIVAAKPGRNYFKGKGSVTGGL